MASVCLDASFPLCIVLNDPHWQAARRWREDGVAIAIDFVVPALFYPEVTSTIRRRAFNRSVAAGDANRFLAEVLSWPVLVHEEDEVLFQRRAYDIATRLNRPKAYDAQYLAVAEILGCELWTADSRLFNAVHDQLSWVRFVGAAA